MKYFLLIFLFMTSFAHANPVIQTGTFSLVPIGHYDFCLRLPTDIQCTKLSTIDAPIKMTQKAIDDIVGINNYVNSKIIPQSDFDTYNTEEYWAYPLGYGDCEDYVLEKVRMLVAMGYNKANLLLTFVRTQEGEGHAVLTVVTENGDYILDNKEKDIMVWNNTPYMFIAIQDQRNARKWRNIIIGTN